MTTEEPFPGPSTSTTKNADNITEYCRKLEDWLMKAYYQRLVATSAYFTALSNFTNGGSGLPGRGVPTVPTPGLQQNIPFLNNNYWAQGQQGVQLPRNNNRRYPLLMFFPNHGQAQAQGQPGQVQYSAALIVKVAPVWKRLLAELIDFVVLLLFKIFFILTVMDAFSLVDFDNIDLDAVRAEIEAGEESGQLQSFLNMAFSLSSELLLLELSHRVVVCFFEAYCLWKAGGTPGKTFLGLRVLHAEDVYPFTPQRNVDNNRQVAWDFGGQGVIVRPGCFLTFPRALFRSAMKNCSLAFFFPICFTVLHFENSRTIYDVMSKSIVVEVQ